MENDLVQSIALLSRTPRTLDALLRDLPGIWTSANEGEETWSVVDVIGHLIDGEKVNWMPRAKMILQYGNKREFEPFDRMRYLREDQGRSLDGLLDEFAQLRSENLVQLGALSLSREDLNLRGRHPVFGEVTLAQLLATWATHDLTHLHQISRVIAHQNREAVGPWNQYLGVLHCSGHSSG
ncbi:hypothetical protein ACPOL_4431 [Acidisarcina polymorpha]|uniref:DinB-like domain-containing protein n=1 Tax=Acidisarcina polymorpha TaxID=2211140 RepID=A0A2Z5G4E4_9BACT|nr:DinB family protein [Acidisarcina polymorpha]AXC13704.1 hypothetical protein ACPOL_4431 [Acidisarcina polymorpha]